MNKYIYMLCIWIVTAGLAGCVQDLQEVQPDELQTETGTEEEVQEPEPETIDTGNFFSEFTGRIDHIHGLGYAGNQEALFMAAHDGLKIYEEGQWFQTRKENNDYMGFSATDDGFYASGHPGQDSMLPNPLGIMKSTDNGETLEELVLAGEVDFHMMAAGYHNHVLFVQSPEDSSLMDAGRFYRSSDDGQTWGRVSAKGLQDEILSVAVHPTNPDYIAAAGSKGIYLSEDGGESFQQVAENIQGTFVYFSEQQLWYGSYSGKAFLVQHSLEDGSEEEVELPKMEEDAVQFFARDPKNEDEMALVTFSGNIYLKTAESQEWELLAEEGIIKINND